MCFYINPLRPFAIYNDGAEDNGIRTNYSYNLFLPILVNY